MKKKLIILLPAVAVLVAVGCKDDMDYRETSVDNDYAYVSSEQGRVAALLPPMYACMDYDDGNYGGAMHSSATDESVYAVQGNSIEDFYNGAWSASNYKDGGIWGTGWIGISRANHYLTNFMGLTFSDWALNVNYAAEYRRYQNQEYEARFVRAYLYFTLLRQYGRVPLITKDLPASEANAVPQASMDELFKFIDDECNAIRDTIIEDYAKLGTLAMNVIANGRANRRTVYALQARAALYHASPLFCEGKSDSEVKELWHQAALRNLEAINKCTEQGMSLMGETDKPESVTSLESLFFNLYNNNDTYTQHTQEVIWARRLPAYYTFESRNFPVGMTGASGGNCPSQNLVDAFEMRDGRTYQQAVAAGDADDNNQFVNRDLRLEQTVARNGERWPDALPNDSLEIYQGGRNGPPILNASPTGYYLKKYVCRKNVISGNSTIKSNHTWVTFRMAELYLNLAEAMYHYTGSATGTAADLPISAQEAINKVRNRSGQPNIEDSPAYTQFQAPANDPGVDPFLSRLENERFVELCFENHRFYDVRRWKKGDKYFTNIGTMTLTLNLPDSTVTYTRHDANTNPLSVNVRQWNDRNYLFPIPQADMMKNAGGWTQNTGW